MVEAVEFDILNLLLVVSLAWILGTLSLSLSLNGSATPH